jgi:hypothetical protein
MFHDSILLEKRALSVKGQGESIPRGAAKARRMEH